MISVVIPLYNVEDYIYECLKSFEFQLYTDFELIIINDGSIDNSRKIVEEYAEKSNMSIRLINQKNAGVSVARNKGIDLAIGKYICFVDSDDMVRPNYLSSMLNALEENKCDLVFCGIKTVSEFIKFDSLPQINNSKQKEICTTIMNTNTALNNFLFGKLVSGVWSLLIKKEIITNNHLKFEEGVRYSEDVEMIWKMISFSHNIGSIQKEQYIYRVRKSSAMSLIDEKRLEGFVIIENLEGFFDKQQPDFSKFYKKYGVARWVWATTWQAALGSNDYKSFRKLTIKYFSKKYIKKLLLFPNNKVILSSIVFILSPRLYFFIIRSFLKEYGNERY